MLVTYVLFERMLRRELRPALRTTKGLLHLFTSASKYVPAFVART
jgi:hypothetical protein